METLRIEDRMFRPTKRLRLAKQLRHLVVAPIGRFSTDDVLTKEDEQLKFTPHHWAMFAHLTCDQLAALRTYRTCFEELDYLEQVDSDDYYLAFLLAQMPNLEDLETSMTLSHELSATRSYRVPVSTRMKRCKLHIVFGRDDDPRYLEWTLDAFQGSFPNLEHFHLVVDIGDRFAKDERTLLLVDWIARARRLFVAATIRCGFRSCNGELFEIEQRAPDTTKDEQVQQDGDSSCTERLQRMHG